MKRYKIAIIHPQLIEGGGSESSALWTAEVLKDDFDVFLISMGTIDLKRLNDCYGTNLDSEIVRKVEIPFPIFFRNKFDALRSYRLALYCKREAHKFDLIIYTYNTMDFGKKGIQYIADFSFDYRLRSLFNNIPKNFKGLFYRISPLRQFYLFIWHILSRDQKDGWKRNKTIVNSNWTGGVIKKYYNVESITVYPPVSNEFLSIPWDKREIGFICISRITPEKHIDKVIYILSKVREKGWNIHLHIIGRKDNTKYLKYLCELSTKYRDWIFFEEMKFGKDKADIISRHKFGISGNRNEAFGIAVAEMIKAGNIVFVPNGGGQVEIVSHPMLTYEDNKDAVCKITKVLERDDIQTDLRQHLSRQSDKFSTEKFKYQINEIVQQFLVQK